MIESLNSMGFDNFVDIVLQVEGYPSPSAHPGNDARNFMSDHNYTNLHNKNNCTNLKHNNLHHNYTTHNNNHLRKNKELWQRNEVMRLTDDDDDDKHKVIHISDYGDDDDDNEGEGRRMKKGEEVRKLHNTLEKRRRATQRELMEGLRGCLPEGRGARRRWSQHLIINSAINQIHHLNRQEVQIQTKLVALRKMEAAMMQKLQESIVRAASHLSNDSGADSGIINSDDDDDDDVNVA